MGFSPVPKPAPRWIEKAQRRAEEARQMREVYAQVNARDGHCCRICRRKVGGVGMLEAGHHHHLQYRSKGGTHTSANVILLCRGHHQAVHDAAIRLSGDADLRSAETGTLCGVRLEVWDDGWRVTRML